MLQHLHRQSQPQGLPLSSILQIEIRIMSTSDHFLKVSFYILDKYFREHGLPLPLSRSVDGKPSRASLVLNCVKVQWSYKRLLKLHYNTSSPSFVRSMCIGFIRPLQAQGHSHRASRFKLFQVLKLKVCHFSWLKKENESSKICSFGFKCSIGFRLTGLRSYCVFMQNSKLNVPFFLY